MSVLEQSHRLAGYVPLARNCYVSSILITPSLRFSTLPLIFHFFALTKSCKGVLFCPPAAFFLYIPQFDGMWENRHIHDRSHLPCRMDCHLILKNFSEMAPRLEQMERLDNIKMKTRKPLRGIENLHHQQQL